MPRSPEPAADTDCAANTIPTTPRGRQQNSVATMDCHSQGEGAGGEVDAPGPSDGHDGSRGAGGEEEPGRGEVCSVQVLPSQ